MDGATGSVHALARLNRMSYSSAYAELKRLEQASLARSNVVGNSLVFEANTGHPEASSVHALVRASADQATTPAECLQPDRVLANLASLGAPLRTETAPAVDMDPEEAVARGLCLTHRHPTLARAYPVLLARNRDRLDMERLRQRATELGEKQALGFFLELTGTLAKDRQLCSYARTLRDRRIRKTRDFFQARRGRYARFLADQRTPRLARDWCYRMDMDMDNFRRFYSKFRDA